MFPTLSFIIYVQSLFGGSMEVLIDRRLQSMIKDYVPEGEILDDLVSFFSIFSDYTRLKMISALGITEMCVSDISAVLRLNQTTVSHQLRFLKNLNAVKTRRWISALVTPATGSRETQNAETQKTMNMYNQLVIVVHGSPAHSSTN